MKAWGRQWNFISNIYSGSSCPWRRVGDNGILFPMFIQVAPAHKGVELGVEETVVFYFQCLFR